MGWEFFTVTCKPDTIIYHELQTHSGILILIPNPFSPRPGEKSLACVVRERFHCYLVRIHDLRDTAHWVPPYKLLLTYNGHLWDVHFLNTESVLARDGKDFLGSARNRMQLRPETHKTEMEWLGQRCTEHPVGREASSSPGMQTVLCVRHLG